MNADDSLARLHAALDEDERLAQACIDDSPHWMGPPTGVDQYETSGSSTLVTGYFNQNRRPHANYHIARHDPARVLRDAKAMRELEQWYRDALAEDEAEKAKPAHLRSESPPESATLGAVLRILAKIYLEEGSDGDR